MLRISCRRLAAEGTGRCAEPSVDGLAGEGASMRGRPELFSSCRCKDFLKTTSRFFTGEEVRC